MALSTGRRLGDRRMMAEINVTPLVDVMLVLLIIFMVTAPMLTQGVDVNLPQANAKAARKDLSSFCGKGRASHNAAR